MFHTFHDFAIGDANLRQKYNTPLTF